MGTNNSRVPEWRLGKCLLIVAAHSVPADRRIGVFVALPPRTRIGESNAVPSAGGCDACASRKGRLVPGQVDAMLSPVRSFIFETLSILMLMELQQTCEGGQRLADSIRFF
jgi:hypothetical protein